MKILIADDDRNLRAVLKNELAESGFDVSDADNGKKAIDMLKKDEYDVLILDLNMPGLNGIDVLKKIKKPGKTSIISRIATRKGTFTGTWMPRGRKQGQGGWRR